MNSIDESTLDQLFRQAHSHNGWLDRPVSTAQLHALYDLVKWGPTSMNGSPARFVFVTSQAAKEKLQPALSSGNQAKTMAAPVTVIVAYDLSFYTQFSKLSPHKDHSPMYVDNAALAQTTAFRNGTLQGAYLMVAARALGLDCGPMSGFNNDVVDAAFFAGTQCKSNFLCNIGYGDPALVRPRAPRLSFDEAASIV